jgi:NUMOD3 motif
MYGFIYLWRDRKQRRYYIGCHWGTEDDGYVCSSSWMNQAYFKRPQDFKRRVIEKVYTSRSDMFLAEERWLKLIHKDELGNRYYNLKVERTGGWNGKGHSEETKKKLSAINIGKKHTTDTRHKMSQSQRGRIFTDEHRAKLSASRKSRTVSDETKQKIRLSLTGRKLSDETKSKMSLAKRR